MVGLYNLISGGGSINIFNRKELFLTYSLAAKEKVLDLLAALGIKYSLKTINRNSPSALSDTRARTGTFGQRQEFMYEYIIYVHNKDYEYAKSILK